MVELVLRKAFLSFGLARGLPLLVFFLAAHILTANQYVNLENMFAVSQLVLSFASFGISGLLAVVNQTKNNGSYKMFGRFKKNQTCVEHQN